MVLIGVLMWGNLQNRARVITVPRIEYVERIKVVEVKVPVTPEPGDNCLTVPAYTPNEWGIMFRFGEILICGENLAVSSHIIGPDVKEWVRMGNKVEMVPITEMGLK